MKKILIIIRRILLFLFFFSMLLSLMLLIGNIQNFQVSTQKMLLAMYDFSALSHVLLGIPYLIYSLILRKEQFSTEKFHYMRVTGASTTVLVILFLHHFVASWF